MYIKSVHMFVHTNIALEAYGLLRCDTVCLVSSSYHIEGFGGCIFRIKQCESWTVSHRKGL